ncbi:hypothetical protein SmJEL517_g02303 [Synchytrium microbalum]|uniref:Uncharacterized protein n=1 Tax=Synchytrium microbalum TaxID=1806994 RepID=A0A507C274_9FUNG|nr:uncharacterized protein SmJEL517_g02303 [Synchytrium microbalum]TPX35227.1 hypothetical protein SmJEL517_g02303 [Synchytrium microbalum]
MATSIPAPRGPRLFLAKPSGITASSGQPSPTASLPPAWLETTVPTNMADLSSAVPPPTLQPLSIPELPPMEQLDTGLNLDTEMASSVISIPQPPPLRKWMAPASDATLPRGINSSDVAVSSPSTLQNGVISPPIAPAAFTHDIGPPPVPILNGPAATSETSVSVPVRQDAKSLPLQQPLPILEGASLHEEPLEDDFGLSRITKAFAEKGFSVSDDSAAPIITLRQQAEPETRPPLPIPVQPRTSSVQSLKPLVHNEQPKPTVLETVTKGKERGEPIVETRVEQPRVAPILPPKTLPAIPSMLQMKDVKPVVVESAEDTFGAPDPAVEVDERELNETVDERAVEQADSVVDTLPNLPIRTPNTPPESPKRGPGIWGRLGFGSKPAQKTRDRIPSNSASTSSLASVSSANSSVASVIPAIPPLPTSLPPPPPLSNLASRPESVSSVSSRPEVRPPSVENIESKNEEVMNQVERSVPVSGDLSPEILTPSGPPLPASAAVDIPLSKPKTTPPSTPTMEAPSMATPRTSSLPGTGPPQIPPPRLPTSMALSNIASTQASIPTVAPPAIPVTAPQHALFPTRSASIAQLKTATAANNSAAPASLPPTPAIPPPPSTVASAPNNVITPTIVSLPPASSITPPSTPVSMSDFPMPVNALADQGSYYQPESEAPVTQAPYTYIVGPDGQPQLIYTSEPMISNASEAMAPLSDEMASQAPEMINSRPTFTLRRGTTNRGGYTYSMGRDGQLDVTAHTAGATAKPVEVGQPTPKAIMYNGYKDGMSLVDTSDLFRFNARKSADLNVQFEFAKWLIETANENEDAAARKDLLLDEGFQWLRKLSSSGHADSQFFLGASYADDRDWDRAFPLFYQATKRSHQDAMYAVARCYEHGWGAKKDSNKALHFYRTAATAGNKAAMYRTGLALLNGELALRKDVRDGVKWLKRAATAADREFPHALFRLAEVYERGYPPIVHAEPAYALRLLKEAAALDFPPAMSRLGMAYEYGQYGVDKDERESIRWFMMAATLGEPDAQFSLAGWYLTGSPGNLDPSEYDALFWTQKSAEFGLPKAQYAMGYFHEMGIATIADADEARRWYIAAAKNGDERARRKLGHATSDSQVSERNETPRDKKDCLIIIVHMPTTRQSALLPYTKLKKVVDPLARPLHRIRNNDEDPRMRVFPRVLEQRKHAAELERDVNSDMVMAFPGLYDEQKVVVRKCLRRNVVQRIEARDVLESEMEKPLELASANHLVYDNFILPSAAHRPSAAIVGAGKMEIIETGVRDPRPETPKQHHGPMSEDTIADSPAHSNESLDQEKDFAFLYAEFIDANKRMKEEDHQSGSAGSSNNLLKEIREVTRDLADWIRGNLDYKPHFVEDVEEKSLSEQLQELLQDGKTKNLILGSPSVNSSVIGYTGANRYLVGDDSEIDMPQELKALVRACTPAVLEFKLAPRLKVVLEQRPPKSLVTALEKTLGVEIVPKKHIDEQHDRPKWGRSDNDGSVTTTIQYGSAWYVRPTLWTHFERERKIALEKMTCKKVNSKMTAVADKLDQIFQSRTEEAAIISQLESQLGPVDTYGERVTSLGAIHETTAAAKSASGKRDAHSSKREHASKERTKTANIDGEVSKPAVAEKDDKDQEQQQSALAPPK